MVPRVHVRRRGTGTGAGEQVLRHQAGEMAVAAGALGGIRTVPGRCGDGLPPGCSPRYRLNRVERRPAATTALLVAGARCSNTRGDAVLDGGDLWRRAAEAVPACAGAATAAVHRVRPAC